MADTISGRWNQPIVKSPTTAKVLGCVFIVLTIIMFHDAYEVRGKDRPIALKIVGFPQL